MSENNYSKEKTKYYSQFGNYLASLGEKKPWIPLVRVETLNISQLTCSHNIMPPQFSFTVLLLGG